MDTCILLEPPCLDIGRHSSFALSSTNIIWQGTLSLKRGCWQVRAPKLRWPIGDPPSTSMPLLPESLATPMFCSILLADPDSPQLPQGQPGTPLFLEYFIISLLYNLNRAPHNLSCNPRHYPPRLLILTLRLADTEAESLHWEAVVPAKAWSTEPPWPWLVQCISYDSRP